MSYKHSLPLFAQAKVLLPLKAAIDNVIIVKAGYSMSANSACGKQHFHLRQIAKIKVFRGFLSSRGMPNCFFPKVQKQHI